MIKRNNLLLYNPILLIAPGGESVAAGGTAIDRSGHGNNGMLTGHAYINVAGINLDGTDDYMDLGNPANLDPSAGGVMSVAAWVKLAATPPDSSYFDVIGKWYSGGSSYELWIYNDASVYTLRFSTKASSANAGIATFSSLSAGVWYFLAGVHAGGQSYAYINAAVGATVGTETFNSSTGPTRLGYGNGGSSYFLNGIISDARIYNRALSANEISQLYNITKGYHA
jgi:hypothetical protein